MRKKCGISFALGAIVFLNTGFAQQMRKQNTKESAKMNWQQYDSVAAVKLFNRDTIGALESYRSALELNPKSEYLRKNYERLSYLYIRSGQSFYNINP